MSSTVESGIPALAGLSTLLDEAVTAVRDGALAGAPTPELAQTLREIRSAKARLAWIEVALTREVDLSGGHVGDGALTPAAWLRLHARMSHAEASGLVATARGLGSGRLNATSAALAAGEIDYAAARQIARATATAPDGAVELIEPHAVETARTGTGRDLAALLARFDTALDPERADREALGRFDRRGLSAATTLDGSVAGRFLLDDVTGAELLTALDAAEPVSPGDQRSVAQRRADALGTIARHFLGCPDPDNPAASHPQLIVTDLRAAPTGAAPGGQPSPTDRAAGDAGDAAGGVDAVPVSGLTPETAATLNDALAAAVDQALSGAEPTLTWIGPIAPGTAARVACDAAVTIVGVDPDGTVRDVHRQRRYFTWTQLSAMIARDGDLCAWPHCDRPIRWSHGHHLVPWSQGGPTTVANGALPCAGHHVLLHEGGWTLIRLTDGRYLARHDTTGRILGPEPHRRPRGSKPPPVRRE